MNPRYRHFTGLFGLAALCHAFAQEYGAAQSVPGASLNHSFTPAPRAEVERTFTPAMRELVKEERERLAIAEPSWNAKQRKRAARRAVLEAAS